MTFCAVSLNRFKGENLFPQNDEDFRSGNRNDREDAHSNNGAA